MTHIFPMRVLRRGLPVAVALLMACAAPAPADAQPEPAGDFLLVSVAPAEGRSGVTREALLRCDPPRGHADAERACAELDAAQGDIGRIPPRDDTYCQMVYAPVTAHARGQWRGRPVEYTETFANRCVMAARTGAVFALDATA
ncbi:SSI family serine proteinase inhibitor [Streptomyces griseicoloratus]|nr:SSI family serine proteinase inhibitor [Streptomyces griseicoloratus]